MNNIINRQSGDTLIDNSTPEQQTVVNRYHITNEHHYHTNDKEDDEQEESNGYSELHRAVIENDYNSVRTLVVYEDVDVRDNDGNTPLHLAARYGHTKCVLILLEDGKVMLYCIIRRKNATKRAEEENRPEPEERIISPTTSSNYKSPEITENQKVAELVKSTAAIPVKPSSLEKASKFQR